MSGVAEVSSTYLAEMASNSIPVGYKQTEVGVIPEDWQLSNIRDVSAIPMQNGLFYEPKRKGKGVPLINVGDMYTAAPVDVDSLELFNATAGEIKVFRVVRGDLFFTRSSVVPSGIAYCNIFDSEREDVVFDSHLIRVRPNTEILEPRYLYLNCIAKHCRTALIAEAKTATMTTIDQGAINRCPVLVPPKKEQTAIANALSDVDALISELEKLIAKKQAIKTATMQQLLTGRTRLPQFALREDGTPKGTKPSELGEIPEDWEVVTLGTASSFINGRAYSLHEWENSGTPVIRLQNLTGRGDEYYYSNLQLPEKQYCKSGDLLFMWSATFGPVIWRGPKAIYHYHIWKIACEVGYGQSYLFYLLDDMTEKLKRSSSSGGTMLHVTKEKMESTKAAFPSYEEQTAIATILSDMDAEIQALEQRLGKTRQIKQGMMQELLTGKTRLVQPSLTGVCHAD
ncbi:Type-1 restriction enzyme EcoKI specificity protein [Klebsiella pneumoniae]|uniref:restriction endonuclease subunit S n=1 Tax=Klebsiella pneumoniae TaxID=573 RepID=UPI0007CC5C96|nr:restriction endonuclease subunit S [Klebsiella pneumoniae]OAA05463.1 Type-1 restriction enzyme EcoKI specificity protein [Klebsiella pneumoniae]